jgi:hypothetical protein
MLASKAVNYIHPIERGKNPRPNYVKQSICIRKYVVVPQGLTEVGQN